MAEDAAQRRAREIAAQSRIRHRNLEQAQREAAEKARRIQEIADRARRRK